MSWFRSVVLLVSTVAGSFALAQDDFVVVKANKTPKIIVEDSSEYNRMNKEFSLYLESAVGTFNAGGLGLAIFAGRNSQILIDAYSYAPNISNSIVDAVWGLRETMSASSLGVHYKGFVGNSFFLRGGLDYRRMKFERTFNGGIFAIQSDSKSSFQGNSTNLVLGLGNDWQWGNFTLGFDWYRIYLPIASQITSEEYAFASDKGSLLDREEYYLKNASAMIGFHLGASF